MKRKISYKNVAISFLMATLVFILGVFIGNYTVGIKYNNLDSFMSDLRLQTMSLEMQFDLVSEDPCRAINISFLEDELSLLNNRLSYLEQLYGTKDPEIIQMKQYYSLLQIRHWLLFKNAQEVCNNDDGLILYFYSNDGCDDCDAQGSTLTSFRKKYLDEVKVYSFDVQINDPALNTLKDIYGVNEVPTIVYNEDVMVGLVKFSELEEFRYNLTHVENGTVNVTDNIVMNITDSNVSDENITEE